MRRWSYFLRTLYRGDRIRCALLDVVDDDPAKTLKRDLDGLARKIDALVHASGNSDAAYESVEIHWLIVVTSCDDERDDRTRTLVLLQQGKVLRRAHLHCNRAEGIDDRRSQRHQRQRRRNLRLEDLFFTLCLRHYSKNTGRWRSQLRKACLKKLEQPEPRRTRRTRSPAHERLRSQAPQQPLIFFSGVDNKKRKP